MLLAIQVNGHGQQLLQTVKGQVVDKHSQQSLPGTNVVIQTSDTTFGTATNPDGFFKFQHVPVGRHQVLFSFIGYEQQLLPNVLVGSGKEIELFIELEESVETTTEVTIRADRSESAGNNELAVASVQSFSANEIVRYAGSFMDPARVATSFAGAASIGDENNAIVIRGNSPRGMAWRLEGIEIPTPNHFRESQASAGGGITMINNNVLANSDFYTGAFPAEFGNATSGVFDLKMRKGNLDKGEYTIQLAAMGTDVTLEGPLSKKHRSSYLVNYRYSTVALFQLIGIEFTESNPDYQDMSFKIYYNGKKGGKFSLFGLGGINKYHDEPDGDVTTSTDWDDVFEEKEKQRIGIIGANHLLLTGTKGYLKTTVSLSTQKTDREAWLHNYPLYAEPVRSDHYNFPTLRANIFYNLKSSARHVLRVGGNFNQFWFDVVTRGKNEDNFFTTFIQTKNQTYSYDLFAQWKWKIGGNVIVTPGLHFTYFGLNGSTSTEPRFGLSWQTTQKHNLSLAAGLHSRMEPAAFYFARVPQDDGTSKVMNTDLTLSKSAHFVAAWRYAIRRDWSLKLEVYHQRLFDVPVENDTASIFSTINFVEQIPRIEMVNEGTGENTGIEITLQKNFSKQFYLLSTFSLFNSFYKPLDGVQRNTEFNANFISTLAAGKEFKVGKQDQNLVSINIRSTWRDGNRIIPIDLQASTNSGTEIRNYNAAYTEKLPDYFRLDVSTTFKKNRPKVAWHFGLDLQNITNRKNVFLIYYDSSSASLKEERFIGLIPVILYRLEI